MALAQLINCEKLAKHLNDKNLIIFDCRFSLEDTSYGEQSYQAGHIPNAVFIDLDKDLSSPVIKGKTSRHPLPDPNLLIEKLAQCGLNNDSKVVIYDNGPSPFASKMWWSLVWLGKRDNVFLLDGGFKAWQAAGLPITSDKSPVHIGNFIGQPDDTLLINANDLEKKLGDDQLTLLDARALPRFRGEVEPMDPIAGHIPGATCANFMENLDNDGLFLTIPKLQQRFQTLIKDKPLAKVFAYCGSGVSACHNLFALCLAGYPLVPLYAGSWSEWINDPQRPIATGD
ncbi:sulfurtransferase [Entomomonas asaccharolytica]|uniref:Sulfurtransferase n=1 Tax=Entomomonas asaccharolytica TaxID=2785331 RepID=A0A974NGP1_9GAMM|nr:sulfurtransferase [Entomomonas asaccharolytica]QQP86323.1 sulfurtransferase [Entomomonas asaccharolytica]